MSQRSTPQLLAAVLIAIGLFVGVSMPVQYVVLRPGPVFDVLGSTNGKPLITITGAPTFKTAGQLDLLTVSEVGGPRSRATLSDVLRGAMDPAQSVVPTSLLYPPNATADQVEQQSTQEMSDSQDAAAVAALRHLGLPVTIVVKVSDVTVDGPAAGKLKKGDVLRSVDGVPTASAEALHAAISKHKPGDDIVIGYTRDGKDATVTIKSVPAKDDPKRPMIGVSLSLGYTSPVKVSIQLDDVGGPSAGLMFTLGIIDKLTLVQENGGKHVAGTGTMNDAGQVGPIGGIRQKMAAAKADGATIFLIPADNCAEALPAIPAGLQLVKVTSVDTALAGLAIAVSGHGSAPTCS